MITQRIDEPIYIDHFRVIRQFKLYSHINATGIDVGLYEVEDTDNHAIMIRIYDSRFVGSPPNDTPQTYGTHFYCDPHPDYKEKEWLANIVAHAMVDVIVSSTENLQRQLRNKYREFTKLMGM